MINPLRQIHWQSNFLLSSILIYINVYDAITSNNLRISSSNNLRISSKYVCQLMENVYLKIVKKIASDQLYQQVEDNFINGEQISETDRQALNINKLRNSIAHALFKSNGQFFEFRSDDFEEKIDFLTLLHFLIAIGNIAKRIEMLIQDAPTLDSVTQYYNDKQL